MLKISYARGFSLVELLVAMVAGLLLVAAVSSLFVTLLRADQTAMQVSRLNQELQSVTDQIADDIQRTGYDASAVTYLSTASGARSPFYFNLTTDLPTSNCILLKYDDNANGVLEASAGNETRAYNYNSTDKAIRRDQSSCSAGSNISSEDTIEISTLSFTMLSGSISTGARTIRLVISGNDKQSPALKLTLQRDVKLRNDGY